MALNFDLVVPSDLMHNKSLRYTRIYTLNGKKYLKPYGAIILSTNANISAPSPDSLSIPFVTGSNASSTNNFVTLDAENMTTVSNRVQSNHFDNILIEYADNESENVYTNRTIAKIHDRTVTPKPELGTEWFHDIGQVSTVLPISNKKLKSLSITNTMNVNSESNFYRLYPDIRLKGWNWSLFGYNEAGSTNLLSSDISLSNYEILYAHAFETGIYANKKLQGFGYYAEQESDMDLTYPIFGYVDSNDNLKIVSPYNNDGGYYNNIIDEKMFDNVVPGRTYKTIDFLANSPETEQIISEDSEVHAQYALNKLMAGISNIYYTQNVYKLAKPEYTFNKNTGKLSYIQPITNALSYELFLDGNIVYTGSIAQLKNFDIIGEIVKTDSAREHEHTIGVKAIRKHGIPFNNSNPGTSEYYLKNKLGNCYYDSYKEAAKEYKIYQLNDEFFINEVITNFYEESDVNISLIEPLPQFESFTINKNNGDITLKVRKYTYYDYEFTYDGQKILNQDSNEFTFKPTSTNVSVKVRQLLDVEYYDIIEYELTFSTNLVIISTPSITNMVYNFRECSINANVDTENKNSGLTPNSNTLEYELKLLSPYSYTNPRYGFKDIYRDTGRIISSGVINSNGTSVLSFSNIVPGDYSLSAKSLNNKNDIYNSSIGTKALNIFDIPNVPSNIAFTNPSWNSIKFTWNDANSAYTEALGAPKYGYRIKLDGNFIDSGWTETTNTELTINNAVGGTYTLVLIQYYDITDTRTISSETVEFDGVIGTLPSPTITSANRTSINTASATFTSPIRGTKFNYKLDNGSFIETESSTVYFSDLTIGTHTVTLYTTLNSNGYVLESEKVTATFDINRLATPSIVINSERDGFSWEYSDYALGFIILESTDNGASYKEISTQTAKSYRIPTTKQAGVYYYEVKAYNSVDSSSYGSDYFNSYASNSIVITVSTLGTPTISWISNNGKQTSKLSISSISNVSYYEITYGNKTVQTNLTTYTGLRDLIGNETGSYTVKVKAKSNSRIFKDSDFSNILTYNVYKLITPELNFNASLRRLTFTYENPSYYTESDRTTFEVFINEDLVKLYSNNFSDGNIYYDIPSTIINASVKVYATNETQDSEFPNPYIMDSDESNTIDFGTWPKCTNLRMINDVLVWDLDRYDTEPLEYKVLNYGEEIGRTNAREFILRTDVPNTYLLTVYAPESGFMLRGATSNQFEVVIKKLDTPSITVERLEDENGIYHSYINFAAINGANYYKVYINGEVKYNITSSGAEIKLPVGSSTVRLQACSDALLRINSELSNVVTKFIPINYHYYCVINNRDEYEIALPFSITEQATEALSNGTLTLVDNDIKEPFEPNTDIHIGVNGTEMDNYDDTYVEVKSWDMRIAGDDVEEVQVMVDSEIKSKYRHHLTLIDPTYELETVILPDIAFTQSAFYTTTGIGYASRFISGQEIVEKQNDGTMTNKGHRTYKQNGRKYKSAENRNVFYEILNNFDDVSGTSLKRRALPNERIYLPYIKEAAYTINTYEESIGFFQINSKIKSSVKEYATIKYYIVPSTFDKSVLWNYNYTFFLYNSPNPNQFNGLLNENNLIATYNYSKDGEKQPSFIYENLSESLRSSLNNKFSIIMVIDELNKPIKTNGQYNYYLPMEVWIIPSYTCASGYSGIVTQEEFAKGTFVFEDFSVEQTETHDEDELTLDKALNRLIEIQEPLRFNNSLTDYNEKSLYTIDESIISKTRNIQCPSLVYNGGKSLYEVLLDLGREFNAVPKLLTRSSSNNKVISFQMVRENEDVIKDENEELLSSQSSIENNVSGLVSNIKNMLPAESEVYYPGADLWTLPRDTGDSAIITTSNCGVVLDKPIYKINQVIISFKSPLTNAYVTTDITPFVLEKTLFDALPNNAYTINNPFTKSCNLYYSRGDNKIYGLGVLEQNDKFNAALGLSSTNYIINNIIKQAANINTDSSIVKDIRFRIKYIPYNDIQVKLTQFNISKENNLSYKAFNQNENLVSDTKFSSAVTKQLERLGNNDIKKNIKFENISDKPNLFECREFGEDKYYLDTITTTFNDNYITSKCSYTKSINKIDNRVGINSEYREYEIPLVPAVERNLNFEQYCYVDDFEYNEDIKNNIIKRQVDNDWSNIVYYGLNGITTEEPTHFNLKFMDENMNNIHYTDALSSRKEIAKSFIVGTNKLIFNNKIIFTGKTYDNFSLGTSSEKDNSSLTANNIYSQYQVRYVDDFGKADTMFISLFKPLNNIDYAKLPKYESIYGNPIYDNGSNSLFSGNYLIKKDASESLVFNYAMNFVTLHKSIYMKDGFTKYLFSKEEQDRAIKPTIYLFKGNLVSADGLSENNVVKTLDVVGVNKTSNDTTYIESQQTTLITDIDGYVIAWPNVVKGKREILFYVNKKGKGGEAYTTDRLYFNFLDKPIVNNNLHNSGQGGR